MPDFIRVTPLSDMDTNPGPYTEIPGLGRITKGEHLVVVCISGDWYQVGREGSLHFNGWVREDALRRISPLEQLAKQAE